MSCRGESSNCCSWQPSECCQHPSKRHQGRDCETRPYRDLRIMGDLPLAGMAYIPTYPPTSEDCGRAETDPGPSQGKLGESPQLALQALPPGRPPAAQAGLPAPGGCLHLGAACTQGLPASGSCLYPRAACLPACPKSSTYAARQAAASPLLPHPTAPAPRC